MTNQITPQAPHESAQAYGLRVLHHAQAHGCAGIPLDGLHQAIKSFPVLVWGLGKEPRPAEQFAELQRQIRRSITDREQAIAQWFEEHSEPEPEPDQAISQEEADQADQEEDPAAQAIRLMRAALTLIMGQQPGQDGGGGSRVPVSPRPPKFPPSNAQAQPPRPQAPPAPPAPDFRF